MTSERRACKLIGIDRTSYRYEPQPDRNAELRQELVKLARQKPRYGYRRLHAVLERRGQAVNVKRVYVFMPKKAWRCAGADASVWCGNGPKHRGWRVPTRSGRWTSSWMVWPTDAWCAS
ncbi:MAG: IS3 family transposase [Terracidiphilus sp.]